MTTTYWVTQEVDEDGMTTEIPILMTTAQQSIDYTGIRGYTTDQRLELTDLPMGCIVFDTNLLKHFFWDGISWKEYVIGPVNTPIYVGSFTTQSGVGATQTFTIPGLTSSSVVSVTRKDFPTLLPSSILDISVSTNTLTIQFSLDPSNTHSFYVIAYQ
jgi:hypothetical protein